MAGFVVVAVIMRPVGGWLSDRIGPIPVLAAGFARGRRRAPRSRPARRRSTRVGTVAFLAMAAALGSGSGATFALIAQVTDPARVGGVTGLVGAAGGLGGFVPAADHGLRLRPHRLLRASACGCCRSPRPSPCVLTADRRPHDTARDARRHRPA